MNTDYRTGGQEAFANIRGSAPESIPGGKPYTQRTFPTLLLILLSARICDWLRSLSTGDSLAKQLKLFANIKYLEYDAVAQSIRL